MEAAGGKDRGQEPSILARLSKFIKARLLRGGQESEDADMISDLEPSSHHDLFEGLEQADIIILGVQRTTKRPTAKHLIEEGFVVRCIIFDSTIGIPDEITTLPNNPLIVGLAKSPDQIVWVRKNMCDLRRHFSERYFDVGVIDANLRALRAVCAMNEWTVIDVDGPIWKTANEIIKLYHERDEDGRRWGRSLCEADAEASRIRREESHREREAGFTRVVEAGEERAHL